MAGRYGSTGRPTVADYQQVLQAYRSLRAQHEQLIALQHQQTQRIAQLERALMQANQARQAGSTSPADAQAERVAELEAQLARGEEERRAALERARLAEEQLAAAREQVAQMQEESDAAGEAAQWRARFLHQQADADSFRRRQERRFAQQTVEERRALLRDMLPLADHLELGIQHLANDPQAASDPRLQSYAANLGAVRQAFLDTLERHGVRPLAAAGEPFDPTWHEAIGQVVADGVPEGHIVQVVQSGYRDPDGLVRPARVLVSAGADWQPAAVEEEKQR